MIEPLEARASASAGKSRDIGQGVPTEPILDPASLADAEFATWLSSARAGMKVALARLVKSSDIDEATLVAIEDGQVSAISIVRSRIIRGLKQLSPEPARLQVEDAERRAASPVGTSASSHRRPSTMAPRWGAQIAAYKVGGTDAPHMSCRERGLRDAAVRSMLPTPARGWRPDPSASVPSHGPTEQVVQPVFEQFRRAWQLEHGGGRKAEAVWLAWFSMARVVQPGPVRWHRRRLPSNYRVVPCRPRLSLVEL